METLQANFDAGYTILLFPEGNRSWDGRLGEVGQGIGRLIKRMQCKVVYVTLPTASLFQPRWATYPRWVPVEINYNGPYEYDDTLSAEDIWKDVVEKITVQPRLLPIVVHLATRWHMVYQTIYGPVLIALPSMVSRYLPKMATKLNVHNARHTGDSQWTTRWLAQHHYSVNSL